VVEINCPADCIYLQSGQVYQSLKKYSAQLKQEDNPVKRRKIYETSRSFGPVFGEIEKVIVRYAAGLQTLTDSHVLESISLVKETYRTEQKGVIYEHTSSNPLVQALSRELREQIEALRSGKDGELPPLKTTNLLDCLEVLESDVQYHLESIPGGDHYLNFIRRNHPDTSAQSAAGGSLIQGAS